MHVRDRRHFVGHDRKSQFLLNHCGSYFYVGRSTAAGNVGFSDRTLPSRHAARDLRMEHRSDKQFNPGFTFQVHDVHRDA